MSLEPCRQCEDARSSDASTEAPVSGMGGWLAFFTVTLALGSLVDMVMGAADLPWGAIGVAVSVWEMFVAVQLFRLHPKANRYAIHYLTVVAIIGAFVLVCGIAIGDMELARMGGRVAVVRAFWLGYFKQSRRVAATFGTGRPSTFSEDPTAQPPPAPSLRLDGWTGGAVRQCPACGLGNPARATRCAECRASLSGTVPFTPSEPCPT